MNSGNTDMKSETFAEALPGDPLESAKKAGLIYVDDGVSGFTRQRRGRGFIYVDASGTRLTDPHAIARIRSLAIPPAWTQVWICTLPQGHIQATGRDGRGRKQYIYHPRWQQLRNRTKFDRLLLFGRLLPGLRERVDSDLGRRGMPKERALAFVVSLLDITLLRIGNPEYARINRSYGLTTLRDDHIEICGSRMRFSFPGKGQKHQMADVRDRRLINLAKKFQELPGQELVRYADGNGGFVTVGSADVNGYLAEISSENFTAKDFRTWGATVFMVAELLSMGPVDSKKAGTANVSRAIRRTARRLGNTQTICRKYYVHPAAIEAYLCGDLLKVREASQKLARKELNGLNEDEKTLMLLLQNKSSEVSG
jgi:DNA topoisomerase I